MAGADSREEAREAGGTREEGGLYLCAQGWPPPLCTGSSNFICLLPFRRDRAAANCWSAGVRFYPQSWRNAVNIHGMWMQTARNTVHGKKCHEGVCDRRVRWKLPQRVVLLKSLRYYFLLTFAVSFTCRRVSRFIFDRMNYFV